VVCAERQSQRMHNLWQVMREGVEAPWHQQNAGGESLKEKFFSSKYASLNIFFPLGSLASIVHLGEEGEGIQHRNNHIIIHYSTLPSKIAHLG
jgi:hypothetical protein